MVLKVFTKVSVSQSLVLSLIVLLISVPSILVKQFSSLTWRKLIPSMCSYLLNVWPSVQALSLTLLIPSEDAWWCNQVVKVETSSTLVLLIALRRLLQTKVLSLSSRVHFLTFFVELVEHLCLCLTQRSRLTSMVVMLNSELVVAELFKVKLILR